MTDEPPELSRREFDEAVAAEIRRVLGDGWLERVKLAMCERERNTLFWPSVTVGIYQFTHGAN